jgi:hypothetical protein
MNVLYLLPICGISNKDDVHINTIVIFMNVSKI